VLRTAFYFIPSAMTGFIVSVFLFRNRVSLKEAFEGLELGEGKPSRPVLRGPGGRKAAWLLGSWAYRHQVARKRRERYAGRMPCTQRGLVLPNAVVFTNSFDDFESKNGIPTIHRARQSS